MSSKRHSKQHSTTESVIDGLKRIYRERIKPVEQTYHFDDFYSPLMRDSDFDAPPIVLLLGQYSVGKTTFIKYLLGRDFPGMRIGPEPTTDRFVAVMHGEEDRVIPGNALAVHQDLPFTTLTKFGTSFLNKLEASQCSADILRHVIIVDTPGVLSGEKQRIGRQYDFSQVVEWFAQRADMILLLFDAHKLDISDEFKSAINALRGQDDKIRVVLNKADKVDGQQLMRVYGALMWSLGKVVNTPEVMRVYIGSFWEGGYNNPEYSSLFQKEQADLLADLTDLPRNAAIRKINELVKRARMARVHALIISHLKQKMPSFFGKSSKQAELLRDLPQEFFAVMKKHKLPRGDFPPIDRFREVAEGFNFSKFSKLNDRLLAEMDSVLNHDIPQLLMQLGQEQAAARAAAVVSSALPPMISSTSADSVAAAPAAAAFPQQSFSIENGTATATATPVSPPPAPSPPAKQRASDSGNPFSRSSAPLADPEQVWAEQVEKASSDIIFKSLEGASEGLVSGSAAFGVMTESGLPTDTLREIWDLSDIDGDGYLDIEEFAVAMYLIRSAQNGTPVPTSLPVNILPPSKR